VKKNDGQEVLRNFAQTIPDFINGIDPLQTSAALTNGNRLQDRSVAA
jgi:hypothetical protein